MGDRNASSTAPLIIDSFAGGGGASTGIEAALGRAPDVAINHNAAALALHAANHPDTLHVDSNIWDVEPGWVTQGRPVGLLWASPDCFPAGTMILTDRGYRPIETLAEGDRVLTHAGRYRRVYATMRAEKTVRQIDVQGVPTIIVSDEHPFYARAMHNVWDNGTRHYRRTLAPAAWVPAKDLRAGAAPMNAAGGDRHFCATPCSFEHIAIPEVGGRGIVLDERLMWLAGRYVGDGWSRLGDGRAELVITCGKSEADDLAERLALWPRTGERSASSELAWHRRDTKTAHQFSTNHRGLVEWLRGQFGHGGADKSFPAWALSASEPMRRALLAGYVSADGSEFAKGPNQVTETVTISKALALSTKALAESLGLTATISNPRANKSVIDGRTVDAKPTYMVRWREAPVRLQTVRDDHHNWSRVQRVGSPGKRMAVFNISVQEDETYIADGIVVHNRKHFSKAKGGAPRDRNIRDLAWVVVKWAEEARPDVICMENVEEFVTWGPVDEDGQPIKELAGVTFDLWIRRLKRAGYKVQWRELRACDYGAPTIRKRWFLIARRDGRPIRWPKPTHGDPNSPEVRRGKLKPWRTAAECIDWSLPCPSIFDSSAEIMARHGLRAVRPLAANTLARVARGMKRYVLDAQRPFLVNLTHGARLEDAAAPFRTITGAHRGEKAVVVPSIVGCGGRAAQSRPRGGDEPFATITAKADACLVAASLTRFNTGATGSDLRDPAPTVTANSWIKKPGGAAPLGVMAPYLASIAHGDSGGRREYPLDDPLGTVTMGGIQHAVIAPSLVQIGYGERAGQAPRAMDIQSPLGTVVAGGAKHAPFAAFVARQFGASTGHAADAPSGTVTAGGQGKSQLAAAFFAKYYGTGDGARHDEPAHTVTVRDRFAHTEARLAAPPFGPEHHDRARQVASFLRDQVAWDGGEFVTLTIDGAEFVVIDIGLRMLTPRELFNAQGFPPDYVIEGVWIDGPGAEPKWHPFTKDVQVSCCGNSVCPPLAEAIVAANCAHLSVSTELEARRP